MNILFKKLAVVIAAAGFFSAQATDLADTHRFATYNIRYTNDDADTEANGRAWCVRSEYVYRIIRDYDFDVFGMQEVTGRGAQRGVVLNPANGLSQREELIKDLPEYDILLFERDGESAARDYSYNAIAYKKDRYELVESGCFWLSPTPDTPSYGWDSNYTIRRTCGWARLKVKTTGDEFYYFVVHCNYGPSLDGVNGARVVTERIDKIAGDIPAVLCGDFNLSRVNHPDPYKVYASKLEDSRFSDCGCKCVPEKNGQIELTTTGWTPLTANNAATITGNEFDYIYTRYMNVHSRYTITENFGRSTNPSDHYPQLAVCSLSATPGQANIYVNGSSQPGGNGSISTPFNTITEALDNAHLGDIVKVTAGIYAESLCPRHSVVIEGGYDQSFSNQSGLTILDGTGQEGRLVNVPAYHDLSMSCFEIINSTPASRDGDGAIYMCGTELKLDNVRFTGNKAIANGAALLADCHTVDLNGCTFQGNEASETGGGAYLKAMFGVNINDCIFAENKAKSGSAVYLAAAETATVMRSTFNDNACTQFGTFNIVSCNDATSYNFVDNTFVNNTMSSPSGIATLTRTYGGSAIYAKLPSTDVKFNMAHCTVAGNKAIFAGSNKANYGAAALNISGGRLVLMNNIIAGNYSDSGIGDVAVSGDVLMSKEQYNLCTSASASNITLNNNDFLCNDTDTGTKQLASLLDGQIDNNNRFTAILADNGGLTPTVKLKNTMYGSHAINILTANLRLVETSFGLDLNNDGRIFGGWATDQRGETRSAASVPGACDYLDLSDINEVYSDNTGNLILIAPYTYHTTSGYINVYDPAGHLITMGLSTATGATVDLSGLSHGPYILSTPAASYRIIIK